MGIYSLQDILYTIRETISLLDRNSAKSDKTIEALTSLQIAIVETGKFIDEIGYTRNTDLTKLWLQAFDKVKRAKIYTEGQFPDYLYQKARFWGNPTVWLREPTAMELIPTLKELEIKCDFILVSLK